MLHAVDAGALGGEKRCIRIETGVAAKGPAGYDGSHDQDRGGPDGCAQRKDNGGNDGTHSPVGSGRKSEQRAQPDSSNSWNNTPIREKIPQLFKNKYRKNHIIKKAIQYTKSYFKYTI